MKRILFALMALAVLCACNENNDNVCTISGTLTDPVDSVRLVDMSGTLLDVAAVSNGNFVLKCEIDPESGVSILRGPLPSGEVCYEEESMGYDPIPLIPDARKIKTPSHSLPSSINPPRSSSTIKTILVGNLATIPI